MTPPATPEALPLTDHPVVADMKECARMFHSGEAKLLGPTVGHLLDRLAHDVERVLTMTNRPVVTKGHLFTIIQRCRDERKGGAETALEIVNGCDGGVISSGRYEPQSTPTIADQSRQIAALMTALEYRVYAQGHDEYGWYRRCDLCDAECRTPHHKDLVHTENCPLSSPKPEGS